MNQRCTVCNHSQIHDINLALLAGSTLDTLKLQFSLSRSALHRHKRHLEKNLDMAEDKMRNNVLLSYLFQLNDYNGAATATVAAARAEGNFRLTLQAVNSGTRIIKSMAKFEVDLDHETIYRLMTSPDYVQPGCLLPGDPQILAGPRRSLVQSIKTECPETPAPFFDAEDEAESPKLAQEPDANPCLPPSRQLELPGLLIPPADIISSADPCSTLCCQPYVGRDSQRGESPSEAPPAFRETAATSDSPSALSHQQPEQEVEQPSFLSFNQKPSIKRDRSGTDAGQTTPFSELIEEIQRDMQEEKESEKPSYLSFNRKLKTENRKLSLSGTPVSPIPSPETGNRKPETASPDSLDESQAAQLTEFLENFSPTSTRPPARQPDLPCEPQTTTKNWKPANPPQAPQSGLRPEPLDFGSPGLCKQLRGTFI